MNEEGFCNHEGTEEDPCECTFNEEEFNLSEKIEWKNLTITVLIILVLTGGSIIGYIFFTNYTNNLAYQSYVQGANENTIRIVQTIQEELSIPTFQVDETTNETRLVWVELERICGGTG